MSRCDIRIVAAGDIESPIFANSRHLAGLSKKWNELLKGADAPGNNNGKDKENDNDNDNDNRKTIFIPQISRNVMQIVIGYINATFMDPNPQSIPICEENVQEYFSAGQFLQMEEIQNFCLDYVKSKESTLENASFLFKLVGAFDNRLIASKIFAFFNQNSQQLDVVLRKLKTDGVSEDSVVNALLNWLNTKGDLNGINLDLDLNLKKLLQEFPNLEDKLLLLETVFQIGGATEKTKAFHLIVDIAKNLSTNSKNCSCQQHHQQPVQKACFSASTQNGIESHTPESLSLGNFEVNLPNFENLPQWLKMELSQLEKNEDFPSFTFVNSYFFESESLRQEFCFISPLPSCTENQGKNWLCDPHSNCTNKFNLMEKEHPPIFIKKSPISGIGIFAKSQLFEGQVLCPYAGKITRKCDDVVYPMDIFDGNKKKYTIDASEYGNWGRFANGELNATPNVVFVGVLGSSRAMSVLMVVKEIAPGEEIIAKYGEKYWEAHKKAVECTRGKQSFFSESTLNNSKPPSIPCARYSPVGVVPRARKSCKRRRVESPETNTNHKKFINTVIEHEKNKGPENTQTNKVAESGSSGTSSSSSFLSTTSSSSSELEPESELEPVDLNNTNTNTSTNDLSTRQGIIYFLLGTRETPHLGLEFWSFNIKTQDFRKEGNLPQVFEGRRRLTMLHHNGDIYFMGGEDCDSGKLANEAQVFNLESQEWRIMEMVERRFDFGAAVLYNTIYVVGGCNEHPAGPEYEEIGTNSVEKLSLDSPSSKWEVADYLKNCRSDAALVVLNGKLYTIGGFVAEKKKGGMTVSNRCECFDPIQRKSKGQWNSIAPMNYKRLGLSAVATSDRIFALGGAESFEEGDIGMKVVEIYDPQTNSWEDGPSMNHPRKFFSAVFFENCIYAIGGDKVSKKPTMEKFDLETQKWTIECKVKADGNFLTAAFR